jgi:hypothetical protein
VTAEKPDGSAVVVDPATYGVADPIDLYLRCPHCGRVAQATSLDYAAGDREGHSIDERHHVEARCPVCHQLFDARGQWVAADDQITCARCGSHSPAAAEAVRARCFQCNLFNWGPALKTRPEREAFAAVEALEQRRMLHRLMPGRFPTPPDGLPGVGAEGGAP